jgi:hypothetical protein
MLQPFDVILDFTTGEPGGKRAIGIAPQYNAIVRTMVHH